MSSSDFITPPLPVVLAGVGIAALWTGLLCLAAVLAGNPL